MLEVNVGDLWCGKKSHPYLSERDICIVNKVIELENPIDEESRYIIFFTYLDAFSGDEMFEWRIASFLEAFQKVS